MSFLMGWARIQRRARRGLRGRRPCGPVGRVDAMWPGAMPWQSLALRCRWRIRRAVPVTRTEHRWPLRL